jgi:hypothetical protein
LDHLAAFVLVELADHLMGDIAIGALKRKVINGFVNGITLRISECLHELCKPPAAVSSNSNSRALVLTKQTLIKAKLDELGIKSRPGDHGSFAAGRSAGDRASFGRPVSGRAATLRIGDKS